MARLQKRKQAAVTTGTSRNTGLPCADGLRLIRALLGDRLVCPRHPRCSSKHRELDLSTGRPGPHDFTVRIDSRSSNGINASTASRAQRPWRRVRPSDRAGTWLQKHDFCKTETELFSRQGLDYRIGVESIHEM